MSVEGHLHDLAVADLLRLICLRMRPALLTLVSSGHTATLVVDAGRVIFARCGAVVGEPAVRAVLGWSEGLFRVGPVVAASPRNVFAPLTDPLLHAVLRESPAPGDPTQASPGSEPSASEERRFDDDLMNLIARLGREVDRLEDPRVQQQGELALPILEEILSRVLLFLAAWSASWSEDELRVLLARQAERTPGLVGAEVSCGGICLARSRGAEPGSSIFFRSVAAGAMGLVTSLLYRLTPRFAAPDRRRLWEETVDAFVADLTNALDQCRVPDPGC